MPEDNGTTQGKTTKAEPKKSKLTMIILIILVAAAGSGAGWYFFLRESPEDSIPLKADYYDAEEAESAQSGNMAPGRNVSVSGLKMDKLEMKDIVVNLSGSGGNRYFRLSATLEYPKDQKKLAEEIKDKEHHLKDTLVSSLRTKSVEDVNKAEELKLSLLKDINKNLLYGNFTGIYFTDYLVQ